MVEGFQQPRVNLGGISFCYMAVTKHMITMNSWLLSIPTRMLIDQQLMQIKLKTRYEKYYILSTFLMTCCYCPESGRVQLPYQPFSMSVGRWLSGVLFGDPLLDGGAPVGLQLSNYRSVSMNSLTWVICSFRDPLQGTTFPRTDSASGSRGASSYVAFKGWNIVFKMCTHQPLCIFKNCITLKTASR